MTETIEVHIDLAGETHLVGKLRYFARRRAQSSVFEYTDSWLDHPDAFSLDPANLHRQLHPHYTSSKKSGLPGALRDSAPDRWGRRLIKRAFRKAGEIRTLSEIDYLLAITDQTRVGALRFRKEGTLTFDYPTGPSRIPPLIQLPALVNAAEAVQSNTESAEDLKLLLHEGSPIGGARPKSVVMDKAGRLAIAKFPSPDDDRSIPHGEVLALNLATKAGMNVAEARILDVAGRPVALITRFDQRGKQRIPFLSAMSLLGLSDGDEGAYTDLAACIRQHSSSPTEDLHELWRRIVFTVMIGNLDDHLRNHGFLYDRDDKWRLSPAYDLNPVPLTEQTRELATWISEEGPEASLDLARRAAPYFAVKDRQASTIIDEVTTAVSSWREYARQLSMRKEDVAVYASAIHEACR